MLILILIIFVFLTYTLVTSNNIITSIINIAILVYFLQFIFSSYFILNRYTNPGIYEMVLSNNEYFYIAIVYFVSFYLALKLNVNNINQLFDVPKIEDLNRNKGYSLILTSIFISILSFFGLLSSINSFSQYLIFIGAFYLIFSKFNLFDKVVLSFVFISLFMKAISGGLFIEFFVWVTLLYFVLNMRYKFNKIYKTTILIGGMIIVVFIQSFKSSYREILWSGDSKESSIELFTSVGSEQAKKDENSSSFFESEAFNSTIVRLNQGWHLERVISHVPMYENFSFGYEIMDDIISSFMPRILMPSKKTVTNREKFIKYTGYNLGEETAMTIGVFGDAYVNFGIYGFIFIFIFARSYLKFLTFFSKKFVQFTKSNILWVPFFSHYFIRSGNDFYMIFNSVIKGIFIFLIYNFIWKKMKI